MGLEDLETMERLFSASNALAPVIRYASKYRRRLFLQLFMEQYDEDKYSNIAIMLKNNYRQALGIIKESEPLLDDLLRELQATRSDLDKWQMEQALYFQNIGTEPTEDLLCVAYVELLQDYPDAWYVAEDLPLPQTDIC